MNRRTLYNHLSRGRLLLQLLVFQSSCILFSFGGELRFCYHGPQRILYKDCPGGFVAKELVKASCMYYYKAENVPNMETYISDDICDEENNMRQLDVDYQDFTTAEFQLIEFNPDVTSGPTDGADPAHDKCNVSCLADWIEPKYWNPAKIFVDKTELDPPIKAKYEYEYVELTKMILIKIINEDEYEEDLDLNDAKTESKADTRLDFLFENSTIITTPLTSLMKLLAKSMKLTYKRCSPFVESSFYTLVFRTMIEFRRMNENFPDMNIVPLKRIMNILDKCEKQQQPYFMINGTRCEDKYVVETITNLKTNTTLPQMLRETSFRWGRYDPIIEAAWSSIAFVHAYCFDYFAEDMLHYSLYVKGMNEIFSQPLLERHWMYPFPVGKGMTLWEMAYDTPDIQNQLNNLDACVEAAYGGSVFETRLDRPFNLEEFFENPQYEDPEIPTPGWNKTIDDYWRMYEQRGFQDMVQMLGYCAPTSDSVKIKTDEIAESSCFL